jgi:hypothetical protein
MLGNYLLQGRDKIQLQQLCQQAKGINSKTRLATGFIRVSLEIQKYLDMFLKILFG